MPVGFSGEVLSLPGKLVLLEMCEQSPIICWGGIPNLSPHLRVVFLPRNRLEVIAVLAASAGYALGRWRGSLPILQTGIMIELLSFSQ